MTAIINQAPVVAEFDSARALVAAVRTLRAEGHTALETFSPFSLADEVPPPAKERGMIRPVMLIAGGIGALLGLYLQYWTAVVDYPLNSGGRPLFSWPVFLLVIFELTILFAALAGFAAFVITGGLTRLHNRIFAVPGFRRASSDRFFLAIYSGDARHLRERLEDMGAVKVRAPT